MEDWHQEHTFWYEKHSRAFIRFELALKDKDLAKMEIARKQMDLYERRMKSTTPEDFKKEMDKRAEEGIREALKEVE